MLHFSTGLKCQIWNSVRGAVDPVQSLEHGVIYVFTGAQPASADAAAMGTLLGKITVNGGDFTHGVATNGLDFKASTNGVLYKEPAEVWQLLGEAAGTAGWFRHCGNAEDTLGVSTTLPRIDGRISLPDGGGEMWLSSLAIAVGALSGVDRYEIAWPAGF